MAYGDFTPSAVLIQEADTLFEHLAALNLACSKDDSHAAWLFGLACPFAGGVTSLDTEYGASFDPEFMAAFTKEVQEPLLAMDQEDPDVLALAHQVGRVTGLAVQEGYLTVAPPFMEFRRREVIAADRSIAYTPRTGIIMEWGMGLNGLRNHLPHLVAHNFGAIALQPNLGETHFMQGYASTYPLRPGTLHILPVGIAEPMHVFSHEVQEGVTPPLLDVVIASRVHMAGADEWASGIAALPDTIHTDSAFIALGPRETERGIGYDAITDLISNQPGLAIELVHDFAETRVENAVGEPNRLIVARLVA